MVSLADIFCLCATHVTYATHLRMRRAAEYELMERAVGVVNLDAKKLVTVLSGSSFIPEVFPAVYRNLRDFS